MMKRNILLYILIIAACLRLYNLAYVPPSPSLDEVSIGYNAYSILQTGKDEYGYVMPMLLRAYDDFRPALYVYLTIPFVALLGLTAVAVRLPSVILSLITLLYAYKIGSIVGKKYFSFEWLGHITSILLAISPWHIYISRLGHEANLGLTLVTIGIYFFLVAVIENKKRAWILCAIFMGISLHGYQSQKIVSPLFMALGALLFWKDMYKSKHEVIAAFFVGIIIALPAMIATVSPEGMVRFRGTSAFSSDSPIVATATAKYIQAQNEEDRMGMLLHSKYVAYANIFIQNYVSHFSPTWVFSGGNREAHKVPGLGLLYMWEAPFLIIGLLALMRSRMPKRVKILIIMSLFIAPVPASITTQAPHAMRSYTFLPIVQLIEAIGFWDIIRRLTKNETLSFSVVMSIFLTISSVLLWNGYFIRFAREQSDSFGYSIASAIRYAKLQESNYSNIEFSHQASLYQSYMFFLFYSRFDPRRYLSMGGTTSGGYEASHTIGSYSFGFLPQKSEELKENILYFYDIHLVPSGARIIERFTNKDGTASIVAVVK